jgi:hypothetical protein
VNRPTSLSADRFKVRGMDFDFATEPSLCEGHRYQ